MGFLTLFQLLQGGAPVALIIPYTFSDDVSLVDAVTTNANNAYILNAIMATVAQFMIPSNITEATFGGTVVYTMPAGLNAGGPLTATTGEFTGNVLCDAAVSADAFFAGQLNVGAGGINSNGPIIGNTTGSFASSVTIAGQLSTAQIVASGTLSVAGNLSVGGTTALTGAVSIAGTTTISAAGGLGVTTGGIFSQGTISTNGGLTAVTGINITGAGTISTNGALTVAGVTVLAGTTTITAAGGLGVTVGGITSQGTISSNGAVTAGASGISSAGNIFAAGFITANNGVVRASVNLNSAAGIASQMAGSSGFVGLGSNASGGSGEMDIINSAPSSSGFQMAGFWQFNGSVYTEVASISNTGTYAALSLRSLKKNIEDISFDSLDVIRRTKVVTYNLKAHPDDHEKTIGIIADDSPVELSGPNHDKFRATEATAICLDAIKKLDARLAQLENQK